MTIRAMLFRRLVLPWIGLVAVAFGTSYAQISSPTPGGSSVPNVGILCVNSAGNAVTCQFASGGGGGGAITAAPNSFAAGSLVDGAFVTLGSTTDAAWSGTGAGSQMAVLKAIWTQLGGNISIGNFPATQPVTLASLPSLAAGSAAIGSVSVSNFPATQPVSLASLPLPAGAATSANQGLTQASVAPATATATKADLIGCIYNTSLPIFSAGQQGAVPCDSSGRPFINVVSSSGIPVYLAANISSGSSQARAINAASSAMATSVKATAGVVFGYNVCNSGTGAVYFRLLNLAAAPTVGTSTGIVDVRPVAAASCQSYTNDVGIALVTGIAFDVTAGSMADSDTTTVSAANTVNVAVFYK